MNCFAKSQRVATLLSESGDSGECGWGELSATIRSHTATMAKSVDEDMGVCPLLGSHITVSATRLPCVCSTYTH